MKRKIIYLFTISLSILCLTSCGSSRRTPSSPAAVREVSARLGVPVTSKDNFRLYSEAASWIGTPYRYGGTSRNGIDCSGFTSHIYREVYRKNISRSTTDILKKNCHKIRKGKLREGDLVFFNTTGKKKKTPTHVGIYLKDGKFVHASTSKGVMVNHLSEPYYARTWLTGGRVKK
ncbi:MAG: NlpC/P60 family protein [Tannerellaceae bacterium]|nr:NlpC/P60 family protein [Tannerellaceae bacterium]